MKAEIAAMAVDDAFADAAEPGCSYQPPGGGDPVTEISVILAQPDEEAELGEIRRVIPTFHLDMERCPMGHAHMAGHIETPVCSDPGLGINSDAHMRLSAPQFGSGDQLI